MAKTIKPLLLLRNDKQPYYQIQVKDSAGIAVNLTGATIYCTMRLINEDTGEISTVKINRQTAGIALTDAVSGMFEYRWQTGDTNTAGRYQIEFEINPQSGGKFTVPNPDDGTATVRIVGDLDEQ